MSLEGKSAVITGGNKGIGKGIATALAREGADIVICGRDENSTYQTAIEIRDRIGCNCLGFPCDVTDRAKLKELMNMATEMGDIKIDYLINNAGIAKFAHIRDLEEEEWDQIISTNLTGPFNVIKAALPHMNENSIIFNIESVAAVSSIKTGSAYNASKAGLHAFSEAAMLDLREEGVRVCSILPGSVNSHLVGPDGKGHQPWKMEPEDIGQVIVDLVKLNPRVLPSKVELRPTRTS